MYKNIKEEKKINFWVEGEIWSNNELYKKGVDHVGSEYVEYCAGIIEPSMRARNRIGIGLSYRPARLHRLTKLIPWHRILGSLKAWKYRLPIAFFSVEITKEIVSLTIWLLCGEISRCSCNWMTLVNVPRRFVNPPKTEEKCTRLTLSFLSKITAVIYPHRAKLT